MKTDDEIAGIVQAFLDDDHDIHGGLLETIQSTSFDTYVGALYGNERLGYSSVVTREVFEVVEAATTYIMKLYFSGDTVTRFEPEGVEDVPLAEQETDWANYVFYRKNPGFLIAQDVIRDALIGKIGVIKRWYDEQQTPKKAFYENRTLDEMTTVVAASPDAEILDLVETEHSTGPLYSFTLKSEETTGQVRILQIPQEEFKVDQNATGIHDARFTAHTRAMTRSDLNELEIDTKDISFSDTFDDTTSTLKRSRDNLDGNIARDPIQLETSQKEVMVSECYILMDNDDDGISEIWQVWYIDGKVVQKEEVDEMPFNYWTPIKIAHKFHGLSFADITTDLQLINSTLFRNMLDNQYLAINGRYKVVKNQVNLTELMRSTPGGWVTVKTPGALEQLQFEKLPPEAFQMLNQVDTFVEKRTGINDRSRGTDPNLLGSNQAAGAVAQVTSLSEQRMELVARNFGEMLLGPLMKAIHDLTIKYDPSIKKFLLRSEFIETDPNQWKHQRDITVTVGLGNGNKTERLFHLQQVSQAQAAAIQAGGLNKVVTLQNVHALQEDIVELVNKTGRGRYWLDPRQAPEAQPEQPSIDQQIKLQELQLKQGDQQIDVAKIEQEAAISQAKLQIEAKRVGLEEEKLQVDTIMKHAEFELEKDQKRAVKIGND